jgi:hypothetical protein
MDMSGEVHDMDYEKPEVVDFGDLLELTAAAGIVGSEDGVGKTVQAGVGGIVEVSVGVLP